MIEEEQPQVQLPYEETLHYNLLQVQYEIENPPALGTGQYQHKYAKLDDILNSVRPLLSKYNLVLHQSTACKQDTNEAYLFTQIRSQHGESISSTIPLGVVDYSDDRFIHKLGSRITYLRRYELCSLLNIRHQDDDDGEADANNSSTPAIRRKHTGGALSAQKQEAMQSLLMAVADHEEFGTEVVDRVMRSWGISHVSECPDERYNARIQQVENYIAKKGFRAVKQGSSYKITKQLENETILE